MDRKEFLSSIGLSAASLVLASCLGGCKKESADPGGNPAPVVDFTIDLTQNTALDNPGGFLYSNGVIIAKTTGGNLIAVSQTCTHQGSNVAFRSANNDFFCSNHGARFSTSGSVLQGPANRPLKQYNVAVNGNLVRITG
jgi:cytochrome b6-f complex iron-sulfur subunit